MLSPSGFSRELAFDEDDRPIRFDAGAENTIYRLVQEALNNVAKHSDVGRATVDVVEVGRRSRS